MSVYTIVEHAQLVDFLKNYSLGELLDHKGISAGIENTNYFITTTEGQYVLTLFEELSADELPYFLTIMAFFSKQGIRSANPIANLDGQFLSSLNNKPAAIVEKLDGADTATPNTQQCATIGETMAKLHIASGQLTVQRDNSRGPVWRQQMGKKLMPLLDSDAAALLQSELEYQHNYLSLDLPKQVIHADLFKDNALFCDNDLSGVIDFYYACNDYLIYDIAVAVNDWCVDADSQGMLNSERFNAFITAYQTVRPLTDKEKKHWPKIIRAAALRFWLSRLNDLHHPKEGSITHIKDPAAMHDILLARINFPENHRLN